MSQSKKDYLIKRITLYNKVKESPTHGEELLKSTKDLAVHTCIRQHDLAKNILFGSINTIDNHKYALSSRSLNKIANSKINIFLQNLKTSGVDTLVAGSRALLAVYKNTFFEPGDLDLLIKNVDISDLEIVENIIKSVWTDHHILVIRGPLVITWMIYDDHRVFKMEIQVVILNIKSWAQYFVTNHGDMCAVGYDLQKDDFVYMSRRFETILIQTNKVYCSDILNFDSKKSLDNAVEKYRGRGFNTEAIYVGSTIPGYSEPLNNGEIEQTPYGHLVSEAGLEVKGFGMLKNSVTISPSRRKGVTVPSEKQVIEKIIHDKYGGIRNICFSNTVVDLFPDIETPNILDLYKIKEDPVKHNTFMWKPSNINTGGKYDENVNRIEKIWVKFNCGCEHSLKNIIVNFGEESIKPIELSNKGYIKIGDRKHRVVDKDGWTTVHGKKYKINRSEPVMDDEIYIDDHGIVSYFGSVAQYEAGSSRNSTKQKTKKSVDVFCCKDCSKNTTDGNVTFAIQIYTV